YLQLAGGAPPSPLFLSVLLESLEELVEVVCRLPCVLYPVSCVVCPVSCVVCRVSWVVCRVSCVVCPPPQQSAAVVSCLVLEPAPSSRSMWSY
ncbi:hypothetical protein J6590_068175, partial [Homalodisca vitripennis]